MAKRATRELALWVIHRLREAGYEALLAGGCVRDMLLGLTPTDYDVATSATPQQVQRVCGRALMVGAQFGVAMVLRRGQMIEVATFRSDVSYTDGRRPDKVVYADARADAQRRDFTINGMFLEPLRNEVLDFVGGQRDLQARVIRAIGRPEERFGEDHLRTLRAVRFAARFDFTIEPATAEAVRRRAAGLARISGERIREELEKIFAYPRGERAMRLARELGLTPWLFGEALAQPEPWGAAMGRLAVVAESRDPTLSLAALLAELPPGPIRELTRRWGGSNRLRDSLLWLARHLPAWKTGPTMPLPDFKRLLSNPDWSRLQRLWLAEELRTTGGDAVARSAAERAERIPPERVNPTPLVTGEDLKALGLPESPALGRLLRHLRELQLDEQIDTREQALEQARRWLAE